MSTPLRLTKISSAATTALAALDPDDLEDLALFLNRAIENHLPVIPEPASAIQHQQHILEELLLATERNIQFLHHLRQYPLQPARKATT